MAAPRMAVRYAVPSSRFHVFTGFAFSDSAFNLPISPFSHPVALLCELLAVSTSPRLR